jgi:hypothetical protein
MNLFFLPLYLSMLKFVNSHLQYLQNQLGISGLMVLEGSLFVAPLTENIFI